MSFGMRPRASGSSARRLFQSYRSYAGSDRVTGANGFVQDRSRWKNGQRRNIPPGASSAEMTAWPTPKRRRSYEIWSAPGPLPTTTTGYDPGGNGRSVSSATGSHSAVGEPAPGASGTSPTG